MKLLDLRCFVYNMDFNKEKTLYLKILSKNAKYKEKVDLDY